MGLAGTVKSSICPRARSAATVAPQQPRGATHAMMLSALSEVSNRPAVSTYLVVPAS
jgi:hypothetical protein